MNPVWEILHGGGETACPGCLSQMPLFDIRHSGPLSAPPDICKMLRTPKVLSRGGFGGPGKDKPPPFRGMEGAEEVPKTAIRNSKSLNCGKFQKSQPFRPMKNPRDQIGTPEKQIANGGR